MIGKDPIILGSTPNGFPYLLQPENSDNWPNEVSTETFIKTMCEIVEGGYQGVRVGSTALSDGRYLQQFGTDSSTPEGRIVNRLFQLARSGKSIPVGKTMANIEREYRKLGQPLPSKRGAAE
jgi:hypothetical protein